MQIQRNAKKYSAFTLIEMLLVIGILMILSGVTAQSFSGLQSSVTLSEESQNISQDIRNLQRSAMLLERDSNESWLYGLGIDFSTYESTGEYRFFKWCSQYSGYGARKTRGELPEYDDTSSVGIDNGFLPISDFDRETCDVDSGALFSYLVEWSKGTPTSTDIKLEPTIEADISYLLFESVSGRAFFYNSLGNLVNYESDGDLIASPIDFVLQLSTRATRKSITVKNLSGRILIDVESND